MSLISHKTSIFLLPEYFIHLLCLPVFPVSVIEKTVMSNMCPLKSIVG